MSTLFKSLGVLLACYVAYGLVTGAIYGERGVWGRTFRREQDALGYWSVIGGYVFLTCMLLFVF
jgi:hypothetical protein